MVFKHSNRKVIKALTNQLTIRGYFTTKTYVLREALEKKAPLAGF